MRYVYDGWNLIAQTTDKYFVWGLDLSQTTQGAGGIGGLIATIDGSLAYHLCYDGNGNVGNLVDSGGGSIAAAYEYDPYGNTINTSGSYADENPFRFATKHYDTEPELYYYGYRYYSPNLGRWLNRDPIGEEGGLNLYGVLSNNVNNLVDFIGLKTIWVNIGFDSSATASAVTIQEIMGQIESLRRAIRDCCIEYNTGCDVDVKSHYDYSTESRRAPKDRDYDMSDPADSALMTAYTSGIESKHTGFNILITGTDILSDYHGQIEQVAGIAEESVGALVDQRALGSKYLLAHEAGHVAGYLCEGPGCTDGGAHSRWRHNIMSQKVARTQKYDRCGCRVMVERAIE